MLMAGELARQCGVSVNVVRYYTKIGLLTPVRNPGNGYRMYKQGHVTRLGFIRHVQDLGFTLDDIRGILDLNGRGESPCATVRQLLDQRIQENQCKIDELMEQQQRMQRARAMWESMHDQAGNGPSICHLIEEAASREAPEAS